MIGEEVIGIAKRPFRRPRLLERLRNDDVGRDDADRLTFFANHRAFADRAAFDAYLKPLRKSEWVVYAKRPFGGPEAVLAYLARVLEVDLAPDLAA